MYVCLNIVKFFIYRGGVFHVKHKGGVRIIWNRLSGLECKGKQARRVELTGVGKGGVSGDRGDHRPQSLI